MWSNYPELTHTFPVRLIFPSLQWFEEVRCGRTTPNSLAPFLYALFSLHHSGSRRFGVVELPQTHSHLSCTPSFPFITVVRGVVELPRTHSNLSCTPSFPFITVVRGGSVWSNYPELTRTFPVRLLFPSSQWFEEVRCGRTTPNSLAPFLYAFFSLHHSGSRRFGVVELPELTRTFPVRLLFPSSQWFEEVRCGRTTPNSLAPFLYAFFSLHHSGSRRFGVVELPELTRTFPVRLLFPSSQWFEEVRCGQTTPNSLAPFLYAFFSLQIRQRPGIRDLLTCVHTRVYVEERPYHHYYGSHSLDTVYTS